MILSCSKFTPAYKICFFDWVIQESLASELTFQMCGLRTNMLNVVSGFKHSPVIFMRAYPRPSSCHFCNLQWYCSVIVKSNSGRSCHFWERAGCMSPGWRTFQNVPLRCWAWEWKCCLDEPRNIWRSFISPGTCSCYWVVVCHCDVVGSSFEASYGSWIQRFVLVGEITY